ncbi:hypothetical protein Tco_0150421 [Tanacetum coccineum]
MLVWIRNSSIRLFVHLLEDNPNLVEEELWLNSYLPGNLPWDWSILVQSVAVSRFSGIDKLTYWRQSHLGNIVHNVLIGSDLCIEESAPASLVISAHPVRLSLNIAVVLQMAESDLLLFVDLPWFDPAEGPSSSSSSSTSLTIAAFLL